MDTIKNVVEVKYFIRLDYPMGGRAVSGGWDTVEEAQAAQAANPEWFEFQGQTGYIVKRTITVTEEVVA